MVDQFHYVLNGDGREELYDIKSDPWETRDLANLENYHWMVEQCRIVLVKIVDRSPDSNRGQAKPIAQIHSLGEKISRSRKEVEGED